MSSREIDPKRIEFLKLIIKTSLERRAELERERYAIQEAIKTIGLDITDLRDGRLDKIMERNHMSPKAQAASMLKVEEVVMDIKGNRWFDEYLISTSFIDVNGTPQVIIDKLTNSIAKINSGGSYQLNNGDVKFV